MSYESMPWQCGAVLICVDVWQLQHVICSSCSSRESSSGLSLISGSCCCSRLTSWQVTCRVSRSPFIARLRLPRFCSGFERHAFAPCDPQTLSFSAGSSYVVEPQLQLQSSPEHVQPGQASGMQPHHICPFLHFLSPSALVWGACEILA